MDKKQIHQLAQTMMFDLNDAETDEMVKEFADWPQLMNKLNKINTEGVEPMIYPFVQETSYLRADQPGNVLSTKEALENSRHKENDYVVLPRVVK